MIYVHNGVTEQPRFDMPRCPQTVERLPWVRVYRAELPEHESHRGYLYPALAWDNEPAAREAIEILLEEYDVLV
jgi:hypothetical protein